MDFDEMRRAAKSGEVDQLFQRAVAQARARSSNATSPAGIEPNLLDDDFDEGPSVVDQINRVEDILKKLNLIKRERNQVLKDLKEKVSEIRNTQSGLRTNLARLTTMISHKFLF
jgi:hypothetical protein